MNDAAHDKANEFFSDSKRLTQAMGQAVQNTLRTHKLLGRPIVVWRDGQVVWVPPEEIELLEPTNGHRPAAPNGRNGSKP